ncbi:hypothetical protein AB0A71_15370 [Kitasatospora aureofaciens]|uniref:hypothetical protein n=1 Tax=Kitasatospora aureofaciens TaxID=1894 RepID=UPI0033D67A25
MDSRPTIAGRPVRPVRIAHPLADRTGTLVGFAPALASAGPVRTVAAGYLGWMPVPNHHIGVRLTHYQENDEPGVRKTRPLRIHHDKAT